MNDTQTETPPSETPARQEIVAKECPVCGSTKLRTLLPYPKRFKTEELKRCRSCGLSWFAYPGGRPVPTTTVDKGSGVWEGGVHFEAYTSDSAVAGFTQRYDRYVPGLNFPAGAKMLDIGCGLGSFMRYCEDLGFVVTGLEVDPNAAKAARSRVKGEIEVATIADYKYTPGEFDCAAMWDVIEHLTDPVGDIKHLTGALRPGGKLLIETPNERFSFRKIGLWIEKLTGYRLRMAKYFYYVEHKFYFNPQNISDLLKRLGYDKVEVYQDKSIPTREQEIFSAGKFPLAGLVVKLIPLALWISDLLPNQNKMVVVATKAVSSD